MPMTLEAWMPKKAEISNRYRIIQVDEEKKEAKEPGAITAEDGSEVVRASVDSGVVKKTCGQEANEEC